ncbi:MAG: SpoIIE family protein phosphatase, partial [Planctomycetota bacterium]
TLLESSAAWLDQIQRSGGPSLSPVLEVVRPEGNSAILLAAVPVSPDSLAGGPLRDRDWDNGGAARRVAVGVVPLDHLRANYITTGEQPGELAMWLLDGEGLLLVGGGTLGQSAIAGSVRGDLPGDLSRFLKNIATGQTDGRQRFEGNVSLGNLDFDGVLALPRPIRILPGRGRATEVVDANQVRAVEFDEAETAASAQSSGAKDPAARTADRPAERSPRLWLVALSNLSAVTRPIEQTTRTAVTWAIIVVIAMSAVLVSSAVQLIRGRNRLANLQAEMVEREMREARQIQLQWLPEDEVHGSDAQNIDIAAENIPATHISGDFYNYFDLNDDPDKPDEHARCALVIGDVTGHGTSAAFLMATTQMLVKTTLQRTGDPGRTLEEVNNILAAQSKGQQFVTILLAILDPVTQELHIASAGHQAPLACRESETGQCQWQPLG